MIVLIASLLLFVTPRHSTPREQFQREHPCPATGKKTGSCPGYVIDHIEPLDCGGSDSRENIQWQTVADAKAKDKWERIGCRKGKRVFDWHILLWG
jgi:5-methylcytosine-specific restriction endonuclease McrA